MVKQKQTRMVKLKMTLDVPAGQASVLDHFAAIESKTADQVITELLPQILDAKIDRTYRVGSPLRDRLMGLLDE